MKFTSPVYSAASGSIAGLTYSHNRGGMYTRARAVPTNPNSPSQQAARNAFSDLATSWRETLNDGQRDGWETYAANTPLTDALGSELILTGQQMYCRCNAPRLRAGFASVTTYPTNFGQADLPALSFTANGDQVQIIYDNAADWATTTGGLLLIQTSRYVAPTINHPPAHFRLLTAVEGDSTTPPTSPSDNANNAFGMDGGDFVGNALFLRVRASNADGRLSPVQEGRVIQQP